MAICSIFSQENQSETVQLELEIVLAVSVSTARSAGTLGIAMKAVLPGLPGLCLCCL